jgi:predicted  nucleic acid-binding Zn-ribbon protein
MERPRSSGVDVEAFSFAKPASHGKPFSLRKFPKNPPLSQSAIGDAQPSSEQTQGEGSFNGQPAQLEAYVFSPESVSSTTSEDMLTCFEKHSTPEARNLGDAITFNFQTPGRTSLLLQRPRRLSMSIEQPKESGSRPSTGGSEHARRSSLQLEQAPTLLQPNETIRTDDSENTCTEANVTILDSSPISVIEIANEALPILPGTAQSKQKSEDISNNAPSRMSLKPVDNQPGAPGQRSTKQKRPPMKRLAPPVVKKSSIHLGEDDLFELLIMKMREREENEKKSASIQQQIETENSDLKGELHSLHNRLKSCQAQLVKSSSDAKLQRGQIDKWKARLGKFKDVINELGLEYDTLREQTSDLKSTTSSLHKEKAEIQQNLEEIRLQVAKNTNTIEVQRSKISSSDGMIAMLREALDNSERRDESLKSQLSHEKKRVVTLESYIQNECQSQARYLTIVRKSQSEMIEKLESVSKLFTTTCSDSRDAMTSTISPVLERCIFSVQELKEQCCVQTMDVEKFTGGVQEAATRCVMQQSDYDIYGTDKYFRIDALAGQLARGVETNMDVSNGLSRTFQEGLQFIKGNLGPGLSLSKQLASSETRYGHLQKNLEVVEPMIGILNDSVKAIRATETDLVHGLEIFGQRLAEAQIPAGNPVLEMEISTKFAENTQLQLELQKVSIELESLRKQLGNRASENEHLQHALTEAVTNEQASKSQNSRLEIEKTALRAELQLVEQRVREDLNIASTKSQDRLKATFEGQIQGLETANAKLETDSDRLKSQLANIQRSLVSPRTSVSSDLLMIPRPKQRRQQRLSDWKKRPW